MRDTIELKHCAETHLRDTLTIALEYTTDHRAVVVYDRQSDLSRLLADAYRSVLPNADVYDFDRTKSEAILECFNRLSPGDLVVLIQSTRFRLSQFRIRIELFKRGLKVIEHPHLNRILKDEMETYVNGLAYDPAYYRTVGPQLQEQVARAERIKIMSNGAELIYDSTFLDPKLNIGHYEGMKNIGGQFPIGELFTEPKDIECVNGEVKLFAFGDTDFCVHVPDKPFTALIENGILVSSPDAPRAFCAVLDEILEKEDCVWVRELGFGLNRAMTRERYVTAIGAYERMCGIHLSLGAKHLQYKKSDFPKKGGFHVDIFVDAERVEVDGVTVFKDGTYLQTL
ncbi:hypothetical protein JYT87_01385 [Nitrospira defluvii]|nr:hypothetical protein [Nitrospira defluvii]